MVQFRKFKQKINYNRIFKKTMTRTILIKKLAQRCQNLDLITAQYVINLFFQETMRALAQDKDVTLRGFGTFKSKVQSVRIGHNPRIHQKIDLPPRRLVSFKPSKALCKHLNQERVT